jgi:hypothetical protein
MGWRPSLSPYPVLCAALCFAGCSKATKPGDAGPMPASPSPSLVPPAPSLVPPAASAADPWDGHPPRPPRPPEPGASASALRADFRARLTTLRVSAHGSAVILRKRDSGWVTAGAGGCPVPAPRMERALDNLARLKAARTEEKVGDGLAFELQIVALMGDEIALQFEVAGRSEKGDLVQLYDDTTVRLRGLDRKLWSARPADWCEEP